LAPHLRYGPNLPEFIVISSFIVGCRPIIFGKEHKKFAFSKSTESIGKPFGIETFLKFFSLSFFFFLFLLVF